MRGEETLVLAHYYRDDGRIELRRRHRTYRRRCVGSCSIVDLLAESLLDVVVEGTLGDLPRLASALLLRDEGSLEAEHGGPDG